MDEPQARQVEDGPKNPLDAILSGPVTEEMVDLAAKHVGGALTRLLIRLEMRERAEADQPVSASLLLGMTKETERWK